MVKRWKRFAHKSKYSATLRAKKFDEILENVEEEYPDRSGKDQYKIAMDIFKRTKYYK